MDISGLRLLRLPNKEYLGFWPKDPRSLALVSRLRHPRSVKGKLGLYALTRSPIPLGGGGTEHLERVCNELLVATEKVLGGGVEAVALSMSPEHERYTVALLDNAGRTLFVKARSDGNPALSRLVEFSNRFVPTCPPSLVVPRVLAHGSFGAWELAAFEDVHPPRSSDDVPRIAELAPYLNDLRAATSEQVPLPEFLDSLVATFPEVPAHTKELIALLRAEWTDTDPLTVSLAHGDFVPWNLRIVDGRLHVWDWGKHCERAPWPYDAIHYVLQTGRYLEDRGRDEALGHTLAELGRVAGSLGLEPSESSLLPRVALYAASRSVNEHLLDRVNIDGEWLVEAVSARLRS